MKKAFTLAELLITLGIIGIVAALTLPILVEKYQKMQTATQLKKSYSEISQLLKRSEVDNESMGDWDYTLSGKDFYYRYLNSYIKKVREIPNSEFKNYMVYKNLNGTKCTGEVWCTVGSSFYTYLSNGTVMGIMSHHGQTMYKAVTIDVNGDKQPNQLGKDVFVFSMSKTQKQLVPYGLGDAGVQGGQLGNYNRSKIMNGGGYACNKNSLGIWCAALVYIDNWEFEDDYPW